MLRINYDALESENNKYYCGLDLFTGVAFETKNGVVVRKQCFQDGVMSGNYSSEFFPENEGSFWIDFDMLVGESYEDEEPFLYQGKLFDGIAIEIDGHFCVSEMFFVNGKEQGDASYSYSGQLESLRLYNGKISQSYEWDEDGILCKARLQVKNQFNAEFEFSDKKEVKSIDIIGDYFQNIKKYKAAIVRDYSFQEIDFSKHVSVYENLFLSSDGVTDEVFNQIKKCHGFDNIKTLTLFLTSISVETIAALKAMKNLKFIKLRDKREDIITAVKRLREELTDCVIVINSEEV